MRKLIIVLAIAVVLSLGAGALWLSRGSQLSLLVEKFITAAASPEPIKSTVYEGNGNGGILRCFALDQEMPENGIALSLNTSTPGLQPNVGTTPHNELALSLGGKVFPFGPLPPGTDLLKCEKPSKDIATYSVWISAMSWPTLNLNFMTGQSPTWRRHIYQRLTWTKSDGAKLEMTWRYEQHFLPGDGWTEALMIGPDAPGLIRVDISKGAR